MKTDLGEVDKLVPPSRSSQLSLFPQVAEPRYWIQQIVITWYDFKNVLDIE